MSAKPKTPVQKLVPAALAELQKALFATALPGEVEDLDAESRAAIAACIASAAAQRPTGTPVILLEPAASDNASPGRRRMMLAIVSDDRPFLVSSVSAAITAAGLDIERLLE